MEQVQKALTENLLLNIDFEKQRNTGGRFLFTPSKGRTYCSLESAQFNVIINLSANYLKNGCYIIYIHSYTCARAHTRIYTHT